MTHNSDREITRFLRHQRGAFSERLSLSDGRRRGNLQHIGRAHWLQSNVGKYILERHSLRTGY